MVYWLYNKYCEGGGIGKIMRLKMNDYIRSWDNKNRKWIYFHRLIAEQKIGRKLSKNEHVHHIDGNHLNNNFSNIKIVSAIEHIRLHKPAQRVTLCRISGCTDLHHAKGLCKKHYARYNRKKQGW